MNNTECSLTVGHDPNKCAMCDAQLRGNEFDVCKECLTQIINNERFYDA